MTWQRIARARGGVPRPSLLNGFRQDSGMYRWEGIILFLFIYSQLLISILIEKRKKKVSIYTKRVTRKKNGVEFVPVSNQGRVPSAKPKERVEETYKTHLYKQLRLSLRRLQQSLPPFCVLDSFICCFILKAKR